MTITDTAPTTQLTDPAVADPTQPAKPKPLTAPSAPPTLPLAPAAPSPASPSVSGAPSAPSAAPKAPGAASPAAGGLVTPTPVGTAQTSDPLAFAAPGSTTTPAPSIAPPATPATPTAAPSMTASADASGVSLNAPPVPQTQAGGTPPIPTDATNPGTMASQIFANDPTRPGAGYVTYNGQPLRVMGTTAAGLDSTGNPKSVAGAKYILQGPDGQEIIGPEVNVDDYTSFLNGPHGPDTAAGPSGPAAAAQRQVPTTGQDTGAPSIPGLIATVGSSGSPGTSGTPSAGGSGGAASSATGPNAGVGLTPTDPSNPLTANTITPNNNVDRVKLAQTSLQSTIDNILNPQFQADERATNALSFGAGRGVSGMNRTALGNVESDYERTKANLANQLLTGATTGSIDDLYKNIGISQQQQEFQAEQQKTAFQQAAQAQGLSDSETQQAFQQALQLFYAGQIDDPTQFLEYLSGQYARPVGATA